MEGTFTLVDIELFFASISINSMHNEIQKLQKDTKLYILLWQIYPMNISLEVQTRSHNAFTRAKEVQINRI